MRALTLKAPWGTVIAKHGKDVENRSWKPPDSILGERIAIHEGLSVMRAALKELEEEYGKLSYERGVIVCTAVVRGWIDADGTHSASLTKEEGLLHVVRAGMARSKSGGCSATCRSRRRRCRLRACGSFGRCLRKPNARYCAAPSPARSTSSACRTRPSSARAFMASACTSAGLASGSGYLKIGSSQCLARYRSGPDAIS